MASPGKIWLEMISGKHDDKSVDLLVNSLGIAPYLDNTNDLKLAIKTCAITGDCDGLYETLTAVISEKVMNNLDESRKNNADFLKSVTVAYLLLQRMLPVTSHAKLAGVNSLPGTHNEMTAWVDKWWDGKEQLADGPGSPNMWKIGAQNAEDKIKEKKKRNKMTQYNLISSFML